MDPLLGVRRSGCRPLSRLPVDETDALRRAARFDWTWATLVGVVGRAFSAAAAAAEDKVGFEAGSLRMKAEAAAVAAFGLAVSLVRGYSGRKSR